jgi:hypothetical protein
MDRYYQNIYTEPSDVDNDTLRNLGPLAALAGVWRGTKGVDVNPKADGPQTQAYIDHIDLQPIDPQTNGPQLLYGLRYHQHIVKPGEVETYHDQVGYWLWEPATQTIMQTLATPRGQVAMAVGKASTDAREFELVAERGSTTYGICSNPFLEEAFRTERWRIRVSISTDGTWSYEQETRLILRGASEPFLHTDKSTLTKIGEPSPNPLMKK